MTAPMPGNIPPQPNPNWQPPRGQVFRDALDRINVSFTYEQSREAYEDAYEARSDLKDAEGNTRTRHAISNDPLASVTERAIEDYQDDYKDKKITYVQKFLGALGGSALLSGAVYEAQGAFTDLFLGGNHDYLSGQLATVAVAGGLALTASASGLQHAKLRRRDRNEERGELDWEIEDYTNAQRSIDPDWDPATDLGFTDLMEQRAGVKNIKDRFAIVADWGIRKGGSIARAIGGGIGRAVTWPIKGAIQMKEFDRSKLPTDVQKKIIKAEKKMDRARLSIGLDKDYRTDPGFLAAQHAYNAELELAKNDHLNKWTEWRPTRKGVIEAGVGVVAAGAYLKGVDITPFIDLPVVN